MTIPRQLTGYRMSDDYEKLFELGQKQRVVCEVDYNFYRDDSPPVRDIAATLFRKDDYYVSCRGIGYCGGFTKEEFITSCKKYNVKFIVPEGC